MAGSDFFPFFTRQIRCAPVAAARRNRSMEKKFRSQKFTIPGVKVWTMSSHRVCSLTVLEATRAARTRRNAAGFRCLGASVGFLFW